MTSAAASILSVLRREDADITHSVTNKNSGDSNSSSGSNDSGNGGGTSTSNNVYVCKKGGVVHVRELFLLDSNYFTITTTTDTCNSNTSGDIRMQHWLKRCGVTIAEAACGNSSYINSSKSGITSPHIELLVSSLPWIDEVGFVWQTMNCQFIRDVLLV